MNTGNRIIAPVLAATLGLFVAQAGFAADPPATPQPPAMGPGMMGMGPGMMGAAPGMMGMGPGMAGYGPGMMGMGQGMMGMGPGMMGPGMMGMGPGMMGMMGPGMMGMAPGMMGMMGPGMSGMGRIMMLDLSTEQRDKMGKIMESVQKVHWGIMGKMIDESRKLAQLYTATPLDPKAIGEAFARMSDVRRQMVESMADTTNQMMALLTPEQKKELQGYGTK